MDCKSTTNLLTIIALICLYFEGKTFLTISPEANVYYSNRWTGKDTTLFVPMKTITSLKVSTFDQITYPASNETYFLADEGGEYSGSMPGLSHFTK